MNVPGHTVHHLQSFRPGRGPCRDAHCQQSASRKERVYLWFIGHLGNEPALIGTGKKN